MTNVLVASKSKRKKKTQTDKTSNPDHDEEQKTDTPGSSAKKQKSTPGSATKKPKGPEYPKKISYSSSLDDPRMISGEDLGATRAAYRLGLVKETEIEAMAARLQYDQKKLKRYLEKYDALETPDESEDEDDGSE